MSQPVLVSVIIPAYNTQDYIAKTLQSIFEQDYAHYEIIVVNDRSTDNTLEIIKAIGSDRIRIMTNEVNSGVSWSRNRGMEEAAGKYVVFFDADDIMSPNFISARVKFIEANPGYIGVCSQVIKKNIDTGEVSPERYNGIAPDLFNEILSFNNRIITCPSNYLFNRCWLESIQVKYNQRLSSSADRFYLLDICKWARISQVNEPSAELIYSVRSNSMSHYLTDNLLLDNEQFKNEVLAKMPLTTKQKRDFRFRMNYILCGGYYKIRKWKQFFRYFVFTAVLNPLKFAKHRY